MKNNAYEHKIFGIGLNKTGTTTLGECAKILGLSYIGCNKSLLEDYVLNNDFTNIKKHVNNHDLFEDWPWPLIYKQLDELYPSSKFILTVRQSEQKWLNSLKSHSLNTSPTDHCRKLVYGKNYPHRNEQRYLDFYRKHNANVREYFKGRDNDFIELCWENGDGFEQLCNFLHMAHPNVPMPHAASSQSIKLNKQKRLVNKILSKLRI